MAHVRISLNPAVRATCHYDIHLIQIGSLSFDIRVDWPPIYGWRSIDHPFPFTWLPIERIRGHFAEVLCWGLVTSIVDSIVLITNRRSCQLWATAFSLSWMTKSESVELLAQHRQQILGNGFFFLSTSHEAFSILGNAFESPDDAWEEAFFEDGLYPRMLSALSGFVNPNVSFVSSLSVDFPRASHGQLPFAPKPMPIKKNNERMRTHMWSGALVFRRGQNNQIFLICQNVSYSMYLVPPIKRAWS